MGRGQPSSPPPSHFPPPPPRPPPPHGVIPFPANQARSAVVEYLGVNLGADGAKKTALTWPPHPSLRRSYQVLKPLFDAHIAGDEVKKRAAQSRQHARVGLESLVRTREPPAKCLGP